MSIEVVKLGGTVLATLKDRELCLKKLNFSKGNKYIIVVSAMGRSGFPYATETLNGLVDCCEDHERDRLLSCGEIVSSVVFSSFLKGKGHNATSVSYLDIGIIAHKEEKIVIDELDDIKIKSLIKKYDILVVPGFVGKTKSNDVITLGRGNSDLTAVILTSIFNLKKVTLYKDVNGVYPFMHFPLKNYIPYEKLSYFEMELLIESGTSIVSKDALMYAKKENISIEIKPYDSDKKGTIIDNFENENEVVGFSVKDKMFDIVTLYPCKVKEEMQSIFLKEHLILKKDFIEKNHYYFKLESSQLLFAKRLLINRYFKKHINHNTF